jgi:hypothetical protein
MTKRLKNSSNMTITSKDLPYHHDDFQLSIVGNWRNSGETYRVVPAASATNNAQSNIYNRAIHALGIKGLNLSYISFVSILKIIVSCNFN